MSENQRYKILIVDDEPDNLQLLYRTLRRDYEVTKAQGPLEALEILKETPFNCILSDHKMPDMDGVEFLKRTYDMYPDTIRLLVTAYSDVEILMNAINYAKIYRYIKKPYSPEELLHIVQLALEYYQLKEDNKKLIVDLKDLFSGTINAIMDALDSKDSYTLGRSRRVAFYTSKIIAAMDLNKTEKATIELAALLHDIGMIGVQEDILHKVEKLTDEEREEIRKHVFYSVKILEDIKQLDKVTDIIRYHHEFYNGAGYPFGIKGEEIPLGARIIAIADAYDSLVSFRPYREGLTPEEALKIIEEKRGEQFDPNILDIFENVVDEANKEWDKLNPYV
ncbi:TPA: response regulator [Candidatus Galligastranaerophilus intestinigallinarum]|nr:response regulator [Candidatus Galligastranaerophilus intestinigallinarum]